MDNTLESSYGAIRHKGTNFPVLAFLPFCKWVDGNRVNRIVTTFGALKRAIGWGGGTDQVRDGA